MLAENIKILREHYGMSQRDFAQALGVSYGVITNLEYGKLQNPEKKMPLFRLISERFSVPLEWILADDPGPLPPIEEQHRRDVEFGQLADDPVVAAFLEFWGQRTEEEKAVLQKAINDFADALRKPREQ